MDIQEALEIVISAARNTADTLMDNQISEAADIVEDMAVNQFGDD